MQTVLIIDDEPNIIELAKLYLEREGYGVEGVTNGQDALSKYKALNPDIIILDLMLPDIDGFEVCRQIRAQSSVPILMLTARKEDVDKVVGLELGADDYLTKPFSPRELVARVRAVLRRGMAEEMSGPEQILYGDLEVDFIRHEARVEGSSVHLTPKEFTLLGIMIKQPGRVFSRLELLELAFGFDYQGFERTVDVHVMNLRKKIESTPAQPRYIQTVYGIGYKFEDGVNV